MEHLRPEGRHSFLIFTRERQIFFATLLTFSYFCPTLEERDAKQSRVDVNKRSVSLPSGGRHTPVLSSRPLPYNHTPVMFTVHCGGFNRIEG
jgi:hypothetical protein